MIYRAFKIAGVNVVILIAGILLVEAAFGGWLKKSTLNNLNVITDVDLNFDVSDLYDTTDPIIHYTRDQYGFRGIYEDIKDIDILTLGGSTTDQRYLDDTQTWQAVMRKKYEDENININIVNAGMDGQSVGGHSRSLEYWLQSIPNLKPRYVLAYVGLNDVYAQHESAHQDSSYDDILGNETVKGAIKSKSVLYKLYRTLKGTYLATFVYRLSHRRVNIAEMQWTDTPLLAGHEKLMHEKLAAYRDRLGHLSAQIRSLGAIPVFVTQVSRDYRMQDGKILGDTSITEYRGYNINGMDRYIMLSLINSATLDVCMDHDVICFDLANEVVFDDDDFYDYAHNTPSGAEKLGKYLYGKLRVIEKGRS